MKTRFKLHVTLLSAAIASVMFTSPLWADNNRETTAPTTTSAPSAPTNGNEASPNDQRPPEQKAREAEKDKDDAKALPKTKPAAGGASYVQTGKTIHYPGDAFSLKAVIPKSLKDVWDGKAAVYIVITMPGGGAISVLVPAKDPNAEGDKVREIVPLSAEVMKTLPAGDYQMAMVVTKLGGDPLNVGDWYGGFKGMLGVKRVKVAATTTPDTEDPNKTGQVTGDADGDGYPDTDPNASQCLLPEGCASGGTTTGGTPTGGTPSTGGTGTTTGGSTTTGGTTTPTVGQTAFNTNCGSCHTSTTQLKGATATKIQTAISNVGAMSSLKSLSSQQISEIATFLGG